MMLSEDQIKRGVLHPERDVQDAIVFYFAKSLSPESPRAPGHAASSRPWTNTAGPRHQRVTGWPG